MIPQYLQGKSAIEICVEMKSKFALKRASLTNDKVNEYYERFIEGLLLIAVKDALCNADGKNLCDGDYGLMGSEAECRAIAFLNTVLPKE